MTLLPAPATAPDVHSCADGAAVAADPSTPIPALLTLAEQHPDAVLRNPAFELSMVADPHLLSQANDAALAAMVDSAAADASFLRQAGAVAVRPESARTINGRQHRTPPAAMQCATYALSMRADCPRDVLETLVAIHPGHPGMRDGAELAQVRLKRKPAPARAWRPAVTAVFSAGRLAPSGVALPPDVTVAYARHGMFDPNGPVAHAHAILTSRSLRMGIVAAVAASPAHRGWLAAAARTEKRGKDSRMCNRDAWFEVHWRWRGIEPVDHENPGLGCMLQTEALGWTGTNDRARQLLQRWQSGEIVDGDGEPWQVPESHRDLSLEEAEQLTIALPEAGFRTSAYMLLLCSPRCPVDLLEERSRHADWMVRLCVAFNRATPAARRRALRRDRNWLVRCAAREGGDA
jgi:hypothetical protein